MSGPRRKGHMVQDVGTPVVLYNMGSSLIRKRFPPAWSFAPGHSPTKDPRTVRVTIHESPLSSRPIAGGPRGGALSYERCSPVQGPGKRRFIVSEVPQTCDSNAFPQTPTRRHRWRSVSIRARYVVRYPSSGERAKSRSMLFVIFRSQKRSGERS